MSPPNTMYLLCREIIYLSWNGRQASIEMGGKLTPWHTVFAWLFQTKLKSWNYFIIRGSYREYRTAVSAFSFPILCVLLALSPFSPASSSFPLHFSLWISAVREWRCSFPSPLSLVCVLGLLGFSFEVICCLQAWGNFVFCWLLPEALEKIWKIGKRIHKPVNLTRSLSLLLSLSFQSLVYTHIWLLSWL